MLTGMGWNRIETDALLRRVCAALLILIALQPLGAAAWELTPFAGRQWGGEFRSQDADLELAETTSYGLILNWPDTVRTEYELYYSFQPTEIRPERSDIATPRFDVDVHYLHVGGLYLAEPDRVRPYLAATAGVTHMRPRGTGLDAETRLSLALGVGAKMKITQRIGLRAEARYLMTLTDSNAAIFCSGGCDVAVAGTGFGQLQATLGLGISF
jgi:hypothetical protein